jgi:hypothetical protein
MNGFNSLKYLAAASLALVPVAAAQACGELKFNAGRGLPFQTYLAPRQADVLVVASEAVQTSYLEALEQAGHRLKVVASADEVAAELQQHHYDIVIAAYEAIDSIEPQVAGAANSPRVLPIVARSMRKSPLVQGFDQVLLDNASFGQYLTVIHKLLP